MSFIPKRKRSRVACIPCRTRKRKCNGLSPCQTCVDWDYPCRYDILGDVGMAAPVVSLSTERTPIVEGTSAYKRLAEPSSGKSPSIKSNSSAAFLEVLKEKTETSATPTLNLLGWNIGSRQLLSDNVPLCAFSITEILSFTELEALAGVYFFKVAPTYGFLDSQEILEGMITLWQSPSARNPFDGVLCGVAALGLLFSSPSTSVKEMQLVHTIESITNARSVDESPSEDLLKAWLLRVIYMRMTDLPNAAWIASCTLMHLIEAAGLHLDPAPDHGVHVSNKVDVQRRIVCIAQHLNIWISYDLGLSRVSSPNCISSLPLPKRGDYTGELLCLLPLKQSLDAGKAQNQEELESALRTTLAGTHTTPSSLLAQCNLVLCLLRRLYILGSHKSLIASEEVLALLANGLHAAREMAIAFSPWHHIVNVPFQTLCIVLAMDTPIALKLISEAMRTLQVVLGVYQSPTMREVYTATRRLVVLFHKRRDADSKALLAILKEHEMDTAHTATTQNESCQQVPWLEEFLIDVPDLLGTSSMQLS